LLRATRRGGWSGIVDGRGCLSLSAAGGPDAVRTNLQFAVVPDRVDLQAWQLPLEANGVVRAEVADKPLTQSPIADEPYGSVLVFRDSDKIQLELFARPPR
jgi:hypothetical protein